MADLQLSDAQRLVLSWLARHERPAPESTVVASTREEGRNRVVQPDSRTVRALIKLSLVERHAPNCLDFGDGLWRVPTCPVCGFDRKADGYPPAHQRDPDGRQCEFVIPD